MSIFKRTIPGKSPARRIAAERCGAFKQIIEQKQKKMIGIAIIFIICGILIKHGKMYFLLAGYNTMPKEENLNSSSKCNKMD